MSKPTLIPFSPLRFFCHLAVASLCPQPVVGVSWRSKCTATRERCMKATSIRARPKKSLLSSSSSAQRPGAWAFSTTLLKSQFHRREGKQTAFCVFSSSWAHQSAIAKPKTQSMARCQLRCDVRGFFRVGSSLCDRAEMHVIAQASP